MVTENWDIFIDYTTASIAEHIENILKNSGKKINDLGALQLEKDVREIQKQVQSLTNNSIRSRFIKLRQVSQILSSGSREEVQRLFMQDDWKLTANDTRLIYSLKSSVRREEAASLLLQK
jgi:diketogulonate reductase-like aldo/keto reductase